MWKQTLKVSCIKTTPFWGNLLFESAFCAKRERWIAVGFERIRKLFFLVHLVAQLRQHLILAETFLLGLDAWWAKWIVIGDRIGWISHELHIYNSKWLWYVENAGSVLAMLEENVVLALLLPLLLFSPTFSNHCCIGSLEVLVVLFSCSRWPRLWS